MLFKQPHPLITLLTLPFWKKNNDIPCIFDDWMAALDTYFSHGCIYGRGDKKEIIELPLNHISGSRQCELDNFDMPGPSVCFNHLLIKGRISTVDLVFIVFLLAECTQNLCHFRTAVRKMGHAYHRVIRYDLKQLFQFCFFNFFHR